MLRHKHHLPNTTATNTRRVYQRLTALLLAVLVLLSFGGMFASADWNEMFNITLSDNYEGGGESECMLYELTGIDQEVLKFSYALDYYQVVPERPGYIFAGYYTQPEGGTMIPDFEFTDAGQWGLLAWTELGDLSEDTVVYAHWFKDTITLDMNYEGSTPQQQKWTHGSYWNNSLKVMEEKYRAAPRRPVRAGYSFLGWFTQPQGGTRIEDNIVNGSYVLDLAPYREQLFDGLTIYARWQKNTTITFHDNYEGGTSKQADVVYDFRTGVYATKEWQYITVRQYWTFLGWYTEPEGGERWDIAKQPYSEHAESVSDWVYSEQFSEDLELYAHWAEYYTLRVFSDTYVQNRRGVLENYADYEGYTSGDELDSSYRREKGKPIGALPKVTRGDDTLVTWVTMDGEPLDENTIPNLSKEDTYLPIYPRFAGGQHTITLDYKNATGGIGPSTITVTNGQPLTLPKPTRTGDTFSGWYVDSTADSCVHGDLKDTDYADIPHDVTAYAVWKGGLHTVTLDYNGGKQYDQPSTIEVLNGNIWSGYLSNNRPSKLGYKFLYWSLDEFGEDKAWYKKVDLTEDVTLYAIYEKDGLLVTFDENYAGGDEEFYTWWVYSQNEDGWYEFDYEYYCKKYLHPTREGYTFDGWYTQPEGGEELIEDILLGEDTTYYAHWTPLPLTVKLCQNHNASDPTIIETRQVLYGTPYEALPTPDAPEGYHFAGWFTARSGGTQVHAGDPMNNTYIYAQWLGDEIEVTFMYEGADSGSETAKLTFTYGKTYADLPSPKKVGYNFAGWYTAKDDGELVKNGSNVQLASKLYARWTPKKYTLDFEVKVVDQNYPNEYADELLAKPIKDDNGNITGYKVDYDFPAMMQVEYGAPLTLPTPAPIAGFDFAGWYTQAVGGEKFAGITPEKYAYKLYAHWAPQTHTITLDSTGGSAKDPLVITNGGFDPLRTLPVSSRTFYTFDGWYTAPEGGTRYYPYANKTYFMQFEEDTTLYARWIPVDTYMYYNYNNGTGARTIVSRRVGQKYGPLPNVNGMLEGYDFLGWFTKQSGGTLVTDDTIISDDSPTYIYAQWAAKEINITFDYQGAPSEGLEKTRRVTYGQAHTRLPSPTWEKVAFLGWYTQPNGGGKLVSYGSTVKNVSDTTLYAAWEKVPYKVYLEYERKYYENREAGKKGDFETYAALSDVLVGSSYDSHGGLPEITIANSEFLGWYTERSGGVQVTNDTLADYTAHGDRLYARFQLLCNVEIFDGISYVHMGYHKPGTVLNISAPATQGSYEKKDLRDFSHWYTYYQNPLLGDKNSRNTTFTVPDMHSVTLVAAYQNTKMYQLFINNDGRYYYAGQPVTITAPTPAYGKVFDRWTAEPACEIEDIYGSTTKVTMLAEEVRLTALYKDGEYTLTVTNATIAGGGSSGTYKAKEWASVIANPAPAGQEVCDWILDGHIRIRYDNGIEHIGIYFGDENVTAEPVYRDKADPLTITGGTYKAALGHTTGENFREGEAVTLQASVPAGKVFVKWEASAGSIDDIAESYGAVFTMPAGAASISAVYRDVDKSALQKRYDELKNTPRGDYSGYAWEIFLDTLESTKQILLSAETSEQQAANALAYLNDIFENMEVIDKTALRSRIRAIEALNAADYTEYSWAFLQDWLDYAKSIIDDPDSQFDVDRTLENLIYAYEGLEKVQEDNNNNNNNNNNDGKKYIRLWGKPTRYESNFINWILCIVCFGWIWMAF